LGIAAVNLSSGYHNAHTLQETIRIADVQSIVERATRLIADAGTKYKYIEREYLGWGWGLPRYENWSFHNEDDFTECPYCGAPCDVNETSYCFHCYTRLNVELETEWN
jgi:hypothetical protein